MLKQKRSILHLLALLLTALFLAQLVTGCGAATQDAGTSGGPAAEPSQTAQVSATQPASTAGPASPTPTFQSSDLHGPTNFLLITPFHFSRAVGATMDDSGATTPLDENTIKTDVTGELKRLLFVMDSSDNLKVYSPGASPVAAKLTPNADGSTTIDYTQTVNSEAGTVTILFDGILSKSQITTTYEQQYSPSMLINAEASQVEVTFTTGVRWVAPNQIPAAPSNGKQQLTSSGGIALSWTAGQNAAAYDVYRLISDQNQQFQLLTRVKGTSYTDNSTDAKQNIHATKGITYAIFSVGPTGVENPGGLVISI